MFELQKPKKQDDDAIIVENVSKRFRIPHEKKTKLFEHIKGAIMGMSKSEMEDKFEEIFEFAELSRFRNMKLKNFSSGMYARLATEAAGVPLTMSAGG